MRTTDSAWALVAVAAALACTAARAQPAAGLPQIAVSVQQPRAFGYVIGDELEQRITLRAPAGFALDPKTLPRAGRKGLWLELAPPRLTSHHTSDATRYLLTLRYQVINVPEQVRTIEVPEVDLAFNGHGSQLTASVDEWPVTVTPITPAFVLARAGLQQAQPDARPPTPDSGRYMWLTLLWIAAIVVLLGGNAVRRYGMPWLRQGARPFAQAARDIGRLARLPGDRATYRRGLQRLHRAFDAAAGHALFGEHLAPLFAAHPELLDLRPDIEQFYADSQREFFGVHADSSNLSSVWALARRCRDAEAAAAHRPAAGGPATPERRAHAL